MTGTSQVARHSRFRSGTGNPWISMQIVDGRTFLYCHLSYLDPTVAPGTALAAVPAWYLMLPWLHDIPT